MRNFRAIIIYLSIYYKNKIFTEVIVLKLKGAIALLKTCAQVKEGESILIVTDTNKYKIAKALADVAISSSR